MFWNKYSAYFVCIIILMLTLVFWVSDDVLSRQDNANIYHNNIMHSDVYMHVRWQHSRERKTWLNMAEVSQQKRKSTVF